ncbi:MAG TPA: HPF/RaiA family ribosome-associated protein [Acidimicrobiia bacterium]|nr:HPF/RaiA family ribosome-associated protein [Acidimicrobiia bacterium]
MPDGMVQWFDVRTGEGRIVRGSREYPLRADDAEPAARHPGARVHFDIRREEGSERAVNATLRVGTRVSRRQRRFGDLAGARTPDAKGTAPFAHSHPDLARRAQQDPVRVAREWAHRMEGGDLDTALLLYAPDATLHVGGETARGRGQLQDRLAACRLCGIGTDARIEGPEAGLVTLRWPGGDDEAEIESQVRVAHGEITEQWIGPPPPPQAPPGEPTVEVVVRGRVPDEAVAYARRKIAHLVRQVEAPVLFTRVKLSHREDPALERPAVVEAALDVNGRLVRAHRAAHAFHEAVDLVVARLEDRLGHLAQHREERTQRPAAMEPGQWRHGALPSQRPDHFARLPDDRLVVRRKAFTTGEATLEEAAFDLEALDHDFFLFREPGGEGDSLLVRRPDGCYGLLRSAPGAPPVPADAVTLDTTPVAVLDIDEAIERMNETGEPFVFFRHPDTGRGNVVYWRYDGHYGLIEPAG